MKVMAYSTHQSIDDFFTISFNEDNANLHKMM